MLDEPEIYRPLPPTLEVSGRVLRLEGELDPQRLYSFTLDLVFNSRLLQRRLAFKDFDLTDAEHRKLYPAHLRSHGAFPAEDGAAWFAFSFAQRLERTDAQRETLERDLCLFFEVFAAAPSGKAAKVAFGWATLDADRLPAEPARVELLCPRASGRFDAEGEAFFDLPDKAEWIDAQLRGGAGDEFGVDAVPGMRLALEVDVCRGSQQTRDSARERRLQLRVEQELLPDRGEAPP